MQDGRRDKAGNLRKKIESGRGKGKKSWFQITG